MGLRQRNQGLQSIISKLYSQSIVAIMWDKSHER